MAFEYSFSKATLDKLALRERIKEGKHAVLVAKVTRHKSENPKIAKDYRLRIDLRKLEDALDPTSVTGPGFAMYLTLPFDLPDDPDYTPPKRATRETCNFLHAMLPDKVPAYPMFNKDLGSWIYRGEEITRDQEVRAKQEANYIATEAAYELVGDDTKPFADLVGTSAFVDVSYRVGSDFPNFDNWCSECPDDWELETEAAELVGGEDLEEAKETPKPKSRKGRRK